MLQPRCNLDLSQKPVGPHGVRELGVKHLNGDPATVTHVLGQVHRGHSTSPKLTLKRVMAA